MKRVLLVGAVTLLLIFTPNAYAVCQKCLDDHTPNAMCWTLDMCEEGATMGACILKPLAGGNLRCDSVGSNPGPECNGADPSCSSGGGGTGGGGEGEGCIVVIGNPCPSSCMGGCFYRLGPWEPWNPWG